MGVVWCRGCSGLLNRERRGRRSETNRRGDGVRPGMVGAVNDLVAVEGRRTLRVAGVNASLQQKGDDEPPRPPRQPLRVAVTLSTRCDDRGRRHRERAR